MKITDILEDVVPFGRRQDGYQVLVANDLTGVHFAKGKMPGFPQHIFASKEQALKYLKAFANKWHEDLDVIAPVPQEHWDHAAANIVHPADGKVWGVHYRGAQHPEEQLWIVSTKDLAGKDERHLNPTDDEGNYLGQDSQRRGIEGIRDTVDREERMSQVADHVTGDERGEDEFKPFMPRPGTSVKKKPHLRPVK